MASLQELERNADPGVKSAEKKSPGANKTRYQIKRSHEKELRKIRNKLLRLEDEIETLEISIADKEKILSRPDRLADASHPEEFYEEYQAAKRTLSRKLTEWEKVSYELEITEMKGPENA